jgi:phospholipid N-methyltransferase
MDKSSIAANLSGRTIQIPLGGDEAKGGVSVPSAREHLRFFRGFLRNPLTVGAIAPSSRWLAEAMIPRVDLTEATTVVELGAGTGAITQALAKRIGPRTSLIALELDLDLSIRLQRRFCDIRVIGDSAENLRSHLDLLGQRHAEAIISALPWSNMADEMQNRILDAVLSSLRPGGTFTAMAYVHASGFGSSKRFRQKLQGRFGSVEPSPIVWLNMPPAFVYHCR